MTLSKSLWFLLAFGKQSTCVLLKIPVPLGVCNGNSHQMMFLCISEGHPLNPKALPDF